MKYLEVEKEFRREIFNRKKDLLKNNYLKNIKYYIN